MEIDKRTTIRFNNIIYDSCRLRLVFISIIVVEYHSERYIILYFNNNIILDAPFYFFFLSVRMQYMQTNRRSLTLYLILLIDLRVALFYPSRLRILYCIISEIKSLYKYKYERYVHIVGISMNGGLL